MAQIIETNRADVVELAASHLSAGVTMDDLIYAAFCAGVRVSSLRVHSNHPCKMVEAARQLSYAASGVDRFMPLMWALDTVSACPDGVQDHNDSGDPIGPLDDSNLPMGSAAAAALDQAMVAYDRDLAQQAAAGLLRGGDRDALLDLIHRWGSRSFPPNGHWAIQAAQYLRIVEANAWRCAEPAIRHIVHTLAVSPDDVSWKDGEAGFVANQQRLVMVPMGWESGAPDESAAQELTVAFRSADPDSAAELVVDRLTNGLAPQSIWDAILLHRAEIILSGGYDEHCVTSVTALYDLYQAAGDADTRLLLLLQAAGWYVGGWSAERDEVLDALTPAPPPDDVDRILAQLEPGPTQTDRIGAPGRLTAAAQTLGWFEAGRSTEVFDATVSNLIARKGGGDWHQYKVNVALLENAGSVSPTFAPRIRAALMLYMRAPTDEDWERYCEVVAAAKDLPQL